MASTATTRNRLEKQGAGENDDAWGTKLNASVIDLLDTALDGLTTKALSGNVTLTSSNYVADESRARMLKFTGTGAFQVTIPSVEKYYIVDNQLTGNLTITTGGGTTGVIPTGACAVVMCDGTNVKAFQIPAYKAMDSAGSVAATGRQDLLGSGEALRFGARGGLASNGAGIEVLWFDRANECGFSFDWTTNILSLVFDNVPIFSWNLPTGEFRAAGPINQNVTP